jgi:hypothetical protein
LAHPYAGIRDDAILYTRQAPHNTCLHNLAHDLSFEFGTQDDRTVYRKAYGKEKAKHQSAALEDMK